MREIPPRVTVEPTLDPSAMLCGTLERLRSLRTIDPAGALSFDVEKRRAPFAGAVSVSVLAAARASLGTAGAAAGAANAADVIAALASTAVDRVVMRGTGLLLAVDMHSLAHGRHLVALEASMGMSCARGVIRPPHEAIRARLVRRSRPMERVPVDSLLPSGPFELRAPQDVAHPVLRVIAARAAEGARPSSAAGSTWADGHTLVLGIEGGGLATSMCAGMAWALERLGASRVFDAIYGVSSGGLIAAYAAAGRMEGVIDLLPRTCTRDFVDLRRAISRRPVLSLDFLFGLVRDHPLGDEVMDGTPDLRLLVAGTDDGRLHTLRGFADMDELTLALRACCAIPVISRETVTLRGHELADGGLIESVPFRTPLAEGATHVLALRSRDAGYRKGRRGRMYGLAEDRVTNRLQGRLPQMVRERPALYDADVDELAAAQRGEGPFAGRVLQLAPATGTPLVKRLETDPAKARAAMAAGARVVLGAIARPAS